MLRARIADVCKTMADLADADAVAEDDRRIFARLKAIGQIIARNYTEGVYGYKQILCYGAAFFRKQARIKKM